MAASTTVRVTRETRERLARLSESRGVTTPDLIEELAARAEEETLLDEMNAHYAALRADQDAWDEHVRERQALEGTLLDGLDPAE